MARIEPAARVGLGAKRAATLLPLAAASCCYGAAVRLHRGLYRGGWRRPQRFAGWVVSIGTLALGGTGRIPAAAWIAARLHARGRKVALASRGCGRALAGEPVRIASDGRFVHGRLEEVGDEPLLLASRAPGVPVLVGRQRAVLGLRALSAFATEVLVLDDGFQHHDFARDVDIVTIDGAFGFGNRHLRPRGPLREPLSALRFADAVGVVDGPLDPEDEALVERWRPDAFRFEARRKPVALRPLRGGPEARPESLAGASVGLLAGLARSTPLRRTLESLGARIAAQRIFPDRHRYRDRDLANLSRQATLWVTSEKEAIRIASSGAGEADVRVLTVELEVDDARGVVDWIESRLR